MPSGDALAVGRKWLKAFLDAVNPTVDIKSYAAGDVPITLPVVSPADTLTLCHAAEAAWMKEAAVLRLRGPVIVVGDIHGHVFDLYRIFRELGLPGSTPTKQPVYLLLGNIINRGEFQVEAALICVLMKLVHPDSFYCVRGSHEFASQATLPGNFRDQLFAVYGENRTFDAFMAALDAMPLAAVINESVVCVHGGLGPAFSTVTQLESLQRPIHEDVNDLLVQALYAEMSPGAQPFQQAERGFSFGPHAVTSFLQRNGRMSVLVRGHEAQADGAHAYWDGRVWTVFSASGCCGTATNEAGALCISAEGEIVPRHFPPLPYLLRSAAHFDPAVRAPMAEASSKFSPGGGPGMVLSRHRRDSG